MRDFLLPYNTKFPFNLFGNQHKICICLTILLIMLLYIKKDKIKKMKHQKVFRYIFSIVLLSNLLIYRISYMYYGLYNIKIHLSLYYCFLINYFFIIGLIINYKPFYKKIYILWWIGCFWAILFPDLSVGIDRFLFYSFFISHNLLFVFILFIVIYNNLNINFKDLCIGFLIALSIFIVSNIINIDFGTRYNAFDFMFKDIYFDTKMHKQLYLVMAGLVSGFVGYILSKIFISTKKGKSV